MSALLEAADELDLDVRIVDPEDWDHGEARGVCTSRNPMSMRPLVEVLNRPNEANLATTLIHEYAHAHLHFDVEDRDERPKREVEAVAYVVGRYFGLDNSNSAFYLAGWEADESDVIRDRLERISKTSAGLIETVDYSMDTGAA